MRRIIPALTCFAFGAHGRRVQSEQGHSAALVLKNRCSSSWDKVSRSQRKKYAGAQKKFTSAPVEALVTVLLALSPAERWAGGGIRRATVPASPLTNQRCKIPIMTDPTIPAAISLLAGMSAGAVGVGVAYPLDTITVAMQTRKGAVDDSLTLLGALREKMKAEGVSGFYNGVSSTMAGQALSKGVVFFAYNLLQSMGIEMTLAAALSGGVVSFVQTPIERIKCVMQASSAGDFASPVSCMQEILRQDGMNGFLLRGLGATLLREVPSYMLYLVTYEMAKVALLHDAILQPGLLPSVISGALAGIAAWVPVYPIDVVKTNLQTASKGSHNNEDFFGCAVRLYNEGGLDIFWVGLSPKLARAVVNHATAFPVFEAICSLSNQAP